MDQLISEKTELEKIEKEREKELKTEYNKNTIGSNRRKTLFFNIISIIAVSNYHRQTSMNTVSTLNFNNNDEKFNLNSLISKPEKLNEVSEISLNQQFNRIAYTGVPSSRKLPAKKQQTHPHYVNLNVVLEKNK